MTTDLLPLIEECPKRMRFGPCGGVGLAGDCEIDRAARCLFIERTAPAVEPSGATRRPTHRGRLAGLLAAGRFAVIGEVNGADTADVADFVAAARSLSGVVDVVSVTDHSGANVRMGNVAVSAHLTAAGIETMTTFSCRDRNRMALQGDLLGVASLGVHNVLCVTGNHVAVGDSPDAAPVFDLDSSRLIAAAAQLRDQGVLLNGRALETRPSYLIGGAAHPFAPPYADRPAQVLRKAALGADFLITQHIFDLPRWRAFLADLDALRAAAPPFALLGGVAVLPSEPIARRVNAGLRGFTIPGEVLRRLRQARDPQAEGIAIAAETVAELAAAPGVGGTLIAPVTGRTNALAASVEQTEIIASVLAAAGVTPPTGEEATSWAS
ncbi:methylenetetrahydrofolate reductase C-terminal domain-containing protein [uncultured Nocardioides sp.]|jgi:methylenetetrahydrofolate reductase (NADPH)|uniref:methylenetetrahydrofolate reductase C-terminal domain-containing protein n=1 Tax=uncultured Nocardioides sp. TaxID=198441 RepID=UPI000C692A51|nr:5,10-methylenetetrahydrofolate reductase [Nocardioides sp.]MCK5928934.1 methylenetetrahydrofolate reductase C-terminal domain-containing protein [Nocardioides sp.]